MSLQTLCRFSFGLHQALSKTLAVSGMLAVLMVTPAFADETADVTKLLRTAHYADALSKADTYLGQNPRDAQMRFLKGVILTEMGKSAEAIVIFTKLTEDFPSLPEPYNNLAVLYASSSQYDKARAALDMAIRTNPSYATAYENLGDIHAKLASQAYDKALQLDSANNTAKSKLTLLRSLAGSTGTNQSATVVAVNTKATPAASSKPAPVVAAKPVVVAKVEPKAEPKAKTGNDSERDSVLQAVQAWAKAWSDQDVKGYLRAYGSDFKAPNGQSRTAWSEERRSRIVDKGRINVRIESPQVTVNGNSATVKFRQIYQSDRLKANSHKTLLMYKDGGTWLIKQEQSGN
ncbi:hypothetical protein BH11PSE12_BH11PSE12_34130 [soil metagenome]